MEEADEETKTCENCKREISAVNFTIHSVHCARNLRLCPVCKEPFPANLLNEHYDALHKLLPCKQCGERVCGTDLDDHIRDSCGNTVKPCRYCELELPRRDLPDHDNYCGTRTEQCSDCKIWIMLKYRQLHLLSNHGFIRLDDDPIPPPQPRAEPSIREGPKTVIRYFDLNSTDDAINNDSQPSGSSSHYNASNSKVVTKDQEQKNTTASRSNLATIVPDRNVASTSANIPKPVNPAILQNYNANVPNTNVPKKSMNVPNSSTEVTNRASASDFNQNSYDSIAGSSKSIMPKNGQSRPSSSNACEVSNVTSGVKMPERMNDQPQVNVNVANGSKLCKDMPSRGAVKKRQAPKPPREPQQTDPIREAALTSALNRYYDEQQQRAQLNAYNAQHGLPPVLSALEKLERLRKMDMLHNREVQDDSWKDRLRRPLYVETQPTGNILGSNPEASHRPNELHAERRRRDNIRPAANRNGASSSGDLKRNEFRDLQPMSPEEFAARYQQLRLDGGDAAPPPRNDRFSEIKSSLHALRRGLNEVTAPYIASPGSPVTNQNYQLQNNNENRARVQNRRSPSPQHDDEEVHLPCEFCDIPVPAQDLVQHQTGCRPDLAQLAPRNVTPPPRNVPAPLPPRDVPAPLPQPPCVFPVDLYEDPVIPCEFCTESLPVYLIGEHQEHCRLENGDNDDDYSD